jgi:thiol-disulfide isomerase/thioredoxin
LKDNLKATMKKSLNPKKILLLTAILILILGLTLVVFSNKADSPPAPQNSELEIPQESTSGSSQTEQAEQTSKGIYQDYSEQALEASTSNTKLLFFHAPWCPQCRQLDESIKNSELPDGIAIFKVDYDSNQTLRRRYEVTIQTTVVKLNSQNEEDSKYVSYENPTWQNVQKELL